MTVVEAAVGGATVTAVLIAGGWFVYHEAVRQARSERSEEIRELKREVNATKRRMDTVENMNAFLKPGDDDE